MADEETNTTVSFRLPEELHTELIRLAEASGLNKHKMARTLVVLALEWRKVDTPELDLESVEEAVNSMMAALIDLRLALGRGVGAILQDVCPQRSKEEIRQWIFDRIITPSKQPPPEGDEVS